MMGDNEDTQAASLTLYALRNHAAVDQHSTGLVVVNMIHILLYFVRFIKSPSVRLTLIIKHNGHTTRDN